MWYQVYNAEIVYEIFDDREVVALNVSAGKYFSLTRSAPAIWSQILDGARLDWIVSSAESAFIEPVEELRLHLETFLERLVEEGLVQRGSSDGRSANEQRPIPPTPADRAVFEPPRLERLENLSELIGLHPVVGIGDKGWPHQENLLTIGLERLSLGDGPGAVSTLKEAAATLAPSTTLLIALGDAHLLVNDSLSASTAYREALFLTPAGEVGVLVRIAGGLESSNEYALAVTAYETIIDACALHSSANSGREIDSNTTMAQAKVGLARCQAKLGEALLNQAAVAFASLSPHDLDSASLEICSDLGPRHPALYRVFAQSLARRGQHAEAISAIKLAIAHDTSDLSSGLLLAELLEEETWESSETIEAALPYVQTVLAVTQAKSSPERLNLMVAHARLQDRAGSAFQRVQAWTDVVDSQPLHPAWQKELGDRLAEAGRFEEAGGSYDMAVRLGYRPF